MNKDFEVLDHSISKESFTLKYDSELHMYHTHPKPPKNELFNYYESEDYISHTDSRKSLFDIAYQTVKKITLKQKHNFLSRYVLKGNVLDIGAGTGDFLEYLSKKDWNVSGVEPNSKARGLAKEKGIILSESINEVNQKFDAITMWHVLEHVYDLDHQIDWLKDKLEVNGTIFVAVPNFESYDARFYKSYWAAFDVPRHLYHFSKASLQKLFSNHDLNLVDVLPMKFDAYYVSMLSEKYKSKRPNYLRALATGWKSNRTARLEGGYSSQIYVFNHANS